MKAISLIGAVLSLACISAAEAPSNYQTYHGFRVAGDPAFEPQFNRALRYCMPEAASWQRGSPDTRSLLYIAALRGCLYRHNFVDRGAYAYPATAIFSHFLDR